VALEALDTPWMVTCDPPSTSMVWLIFHLQMKIWFSPYRIVRRVNKPPRLVGATNLYAPNFALKYAQRKHTIVPAGMTTKRKAGMTMGWTKRKVGKLGTKNTIAPINP